MNLRKTVYKMGRSMSSLKKVMDAFDHICTVIYSGYIGGQLSKCGSHFYVKKYMALLRGAQYISIGDNVWFGKGVQLTAWSHSRANQVFAPEIIIGNNCSVGDYSHITAINKIVIGDNVLLGKNVLITDNAHGMSTFPSMSISPINRELYSKGAVTIEDNVWLGERAAILPGVHIGYGAIIGAGSIVTKDIPPYAIACGNPARIIKQIIH